MVIDKGAVCILTMIFTITIMNALAYCDREKCCTYFNNYIRVCIGCASKILYQGLRITFYALVKQYISFLLMFNATYIFISALASLVFNASESEVKVVSLLLSALCSSIYVSRDVILNKLKGLRKGRIRWISWFTLLHFSWLLPVVLIAYRISTDPSLGSLAMSFLILLILVYMFLAVEHYRNLYKTRALTCYYIGKSQIKRKPIIVLYLVLGAISILAAICR